MSEPAPSVRERIGALSRGFRSRYLRYDDLTAQLVAWAEAFPDVVRLSSIARTEEGEAAELLRELCTLYALTTIEDDLAWFMGHNRISIPKAKEVLPLVNAQCEKLRPHTEALVEGFGVAWGALKIPILED